MHASRLVIDMPIRAIPGSNSKRGFVNPKTGKVIIADKAKGKAAYTAAVRLFASQAATDQGWQPTIDAVTLKIVFEFSRPASHCGTGKNLGKIKDSAPRHVTTKPDLTNLVKTTEDALVGIAWRDDSQVVFQQIVKKYAKRDFVRIEITRHDLPQDPVL